MRRSPLLILLGGCLLTASAGWADDVGYVDCYKYPGNTQVLAKAAKTQEVVTSLPCGQRFTILAYGVFFSRIQTGDGKVGYVYSYLISREDSGTSVRQPTSAQPKPTPATRPQSAPAQPAPAQAPTPTSNVPAANATIVESKPNAPTQPQPTAVQPAAAQTPAPAPTVPAPSATAAQPEPTKPAQTQLAPDQPAPAQAPAPTSNVEARSAAAAQPEPDAPAQPQPQPTPVRPAAEAPRGAGARTDLGRPIPRLSREPMAEFFAGYMYLRLSGSGYGSNIHGALGSFGWNVKPWLQMVADTSYSVATVSGTRTVLYGNHFGPRIFHRARNKRGATPFAEVLIGGSRADTTVGGSGGYKFSDNGFSIKAGGGLDWRLSPHVTMRLFDVDYYRTPFLSTAQNNYLASSGIVLRLFGRRTQ